MHPPFGWLSIDEAGTGQRMALASRNPDSDVSDSSCSTAGSEVAGQHAYQGRRSEPRNYRSHHRDLGHYHFGDCDPADDLARPHDEAGPEGSKYAGTSAGVLALADSTGKAHVSALAVHSGIVTHTGVAGVTLGGADGGSADHAQAQIVD
jgi:hypothetical protein